MNSQSWFLIEFAIIAIKTLAVLAVVYYVARWAKAHYRRGE